MTYQEALKLYPNDYNERKVYLRNKFNILISRIPLYFKTNEMNVFKTSMTYFFEHIKLKIKK